MAKQLLEAKELRKEKEAERAKPSFWKELLLAYAPIGRLTWVLHLFYWYSLGVSILALIILFIATASKSIGDAIAVTAFLSLPILIGLLPVYLLAKWSYKRSSKTRTEAIKKSLEIISNTNYVGLS